MLVNAYREEEVEGETRVVLGFHPSVAPIKAAVLPLVNKDGMFLQIGHHLPMIVGQVSRSTPADPAKVNLLQDTLDPALLDAAGVDIVIVHKEYAGSDGGLGALARSRFGSPFYEDDQVAAFEVPKYHGGPPGFTSVPPIQQAPTVIGDGGAVAQSGQGGATQYYPGGFDIDQFTFAAPQLTVGNVMGTRAVVRWWTVKLAGLSNWLAIQAPWVWLASSCARSIAPFMPFSRGVRSKVAP